MFGFIFQFVYYIAFELLEKDQIVTKVTLHHVIDQALVSYISLFYALPFEIRNSSSVSIFKKVDSQHFFSK